MKISLKSFVLPCCCHLSSWIRVKCNCKKTSSQRSLDDEEAASAGSGAVGIPLVAAEVGVGDDAAAGQLVKHSCHDSGIDIRDPPAVAPSGAVPIAPAPVVAPIAAKKVYSDADIVLSADWVPPLTIAPSHCIESSPRNSSTTSSQQSSLSTTQPEGSGRKKTSSVSFSVDEHDPHSASQLDKGGETKKNKVRRGRDRITSVS